MRLFCFESVKTHQVLIFFYVRTKIRHETESCLAEDTSVKACIQCSPLKSARLKLSPGSSGGDCLSPASSSLYHNKMFSLDL